MQSDAENLSSSLQSLVESNLGEQLRFPNHEDGGELEPFIWNVAEQGEFCPWQLLRQEGWLHEIDQATVLEKWLAPEQVGSVNGEQWLLPELDRAGILLNSATQTDRSQLYQDLLALLQAQLENLQAFELSCDADYSLVILVGQLKPPDAASTAAWICLSPLVPHATRIDTDAPLKMSAVPATESALENLAAQPQQTQIQAEITAILARLGTIKLYGYYGGDYEQMHDYRLVDAAGETLEQAVEQALIQAGLLEIYQFEAFQPDGDSAQFKRLEKFLQKTFSERWIYRFSFWNYEHFYVIGQDAAGNWGGVALRSRFTYNP